MDHQEGIREDISRHGDVVASVLDPLFMDDWQKFFRSKFILKEEWEVWHGDKFVGNSERKPKSGKRFSAFPVYGLNRSSLNDFTQDACSAVNGKGGGCVCVFRQGPPNSQPFGMWLCWLVAKEEFIVCDLQNSMVSSSLIEAVSNLNWEEGPRKEVFFAPFNKKKR